MKRDRIYWVSSLFDLGKITQAPNSNFMQMKVIYFPVFKQMIVNFGKLFSFLFFFCSFHLYPFVYFTYNSPFYCNLFSTMLKRKQTLDLQVKNLSLSTYNLI